MKLSIHGAAQTVTGSQHLIEVNGHRLLLECGLYQGRRQETYRRNLDFPYQAGDVDAVLLSHAHIDHSGNLPNLVKQGFEGPIYATPATAHLSNVMLMDSGHIQENDAAYVNMKRARKGEPSVEPLYTLEDAARVAQYFVPQKYETWFQPIPGVAARFVDAGHILGSAAICLDVEESRRTTRLWFSGDIGRRDLPMLRDPVLPERADFLLMECTYGDKPHAHPEEAYEELRTVVKRTVERGGKVIIPAFAVGRTQELVYVLHQMFENGEIPRVPVVVDSPLAVKATDIFRAHPECFDDETRTFMNKNGYRSALGFDLLTYTRSVEESKALNDQKDPMIIISASGMAEAGRILHHLKNNIGDPRNTVLIVSWQAPYTLGRRLADREEKVRIFGESYHRRAEVATIGGLSAHAGQTFLREYARASEGTLRAIALVHGEPGPANALRDCLEADGVQAPIHYPAPHETLDI